MSIAEIFTQLTNTYGQPTPAMIFENDSTFRQLHESRAPPELLFCQLENCQEIATLGAVGYTSAQMLANTTHLLQVCGYYTLEFCEWIALPAHTQTYTYLKAFIQGLIPPYPIGRANYQQSGIRRSDIEGGE